MVAVITFVIWVLVVLLVLVVLVLAMPLRIELDLSKAEAVRFSAALRPFGRYGPRIALSDRREKRTKVKPKAKPARKRRWTQSPKRIAGAAIDLATELVGRVRIEAAALDLRFGLGDPGETGQAYGQMAPLIYGTGAMSRVHINVEPAFDETVLDGRASMVMSLIPLTLIPPFIRFGWAVFGRRR